MQWWRTDSSYFGIHKMADIALGQSSKDGK